MLRVLRPEKLARSGQSRQCCSLLPTYIRQQTLWLNHSLDLCVREGERERGREGERERGKEGERKLERNGRWIKIEVES